VPVRVYRKSGAYTDLTVDESQTLGIDNYWYSLDSYKMYAGTTGYVRIKNVGTTGDVLADAVKFQALSKRLSQTTVYLAPTPEAYTYDADGNLITDGKWTYTYDGENRLIAMTSRNDETIVTPVAYRKKITFKYDYMGRRAAKATFDWDTDTSNYSVYTTTYTSFVYDGWNLMTELSSGSIKRSYTWGPDLSGSLQGAGGIGGLVFVRDSGTGGSYYPAYDGNGNLTAMVSSSTGAAVAKYEYSPYGELLTSTGSYAGTNPFRFSTKYTDSETGLAYFGYRYYNPETGRWINRDLIEERGGKNLYGYVLNDPIASIDPYGQSTFCGNLSMPCNKGSANWPVYGNSDRAKFIIPQGYVGCVTLLVPKGIYCTGSCEEIKTWEPGGVNILDHEACHACAFEDGGLPCYLYTWIPGDLTGYCDKNAKKTKPSW
jgi:RHS repeat-associated protein